MNLIEDFYDHDGRTSYIFTADHGMTDWGEFQTDFVNFLELFMNRLNFKLLIYRVTWSRTSI